MRKFFSRVFHFIVQLLFRLNIHDTQCGAKVMKREVVEKIHPNLRIADMAFDINLLVAVKHAGFRIREVPTEWTDKAGSKVTSSLFRSSLTMFLSVVRVRLIYWPRIYKFLRPLRPLEGWIYKKLRAPQPLSGPQVQKRGSKVENGGSRNRAPFSNFPPPVWTLVFSAPNEPARRRPAAAG